MAVGTNESQSVLATPTPPPAGAGRGRGWRWSRNLLTHAFMVPLCIVWIYPFVWMVSASFKPNSQVFGGLNLIPNDPRVENYVSAWTQGNIGLYFFNSTMVTLGGVAIVVVTTSMMGYALGRLQFPGKRVIIGGLVALVVLPSGYTIIPVFDLLRSLGLDSSLWGIILAESGSANILQLLLYTSYFSQLPSVLDEAASIDGAGRFRIFLTVYMPLAMPVTATVIILQVIASWNSFLVPLVLTLSRPELQTLAVGVYSFQGENLTNYGEMAAASTISLLPIIIVFLFLQRYFIEGMAGAVKQ